ncbi:LacI family DNA-binding transcriptional regulator [Streptomonospora litoralis]|uniref:Prophage phiRv2 integrase n=1 Tax=Streptomonospora litoralis TaxID=2498135 RepID=A0A4P6Q835_9ACTN|nr:LacI family DNA-binding transcriptional regulator [Streptomonospora litoralis]QBI56885.1 Putative prophage phiRv2 integrase [Streptomonospora litoralis]
MPHILRPYVEKRRNGTYRVRTRESDGTWIPLGSGFSSEERALEHGWKEIGRIRDGVWIDPRESDITLTTWARSWLPAQVLQLSSREQYVYLLNNFVLPEYGDRSLRSLTYADHEINTWEQHLRTAYSASTATQARGLLRRMLQDASASKLMERNPAERQARRGSVEVRRLQQQQKRKAEEEKWTTPLGALLIAERMALLAGRDDEMILGITKAYTGMRTSELIGLERDRVTATEIDVHWQLYALNDGSMIRKYPKDGSLRKIAIPPHVALLLHHQMRKTTAVDPLTAPMCPCVKHSAPDFRQQYGHPAGVHVFRGSAGGRTRLDSGTTLADVASTAGVSTTTVSNVINRPDKVRGSTRARVEQVMEELGCDTAADASGCAPHLRRNGFRTWIFHPAATGWYPEKKPNPAHPVPIVPGGLTGTPARGRGAAKRAGASWLPVVAGFTAHGLRHSQQTWMDEDEIPEKLKRQVMGHADEQTVQAMYGHVTPDMRERRIRALSARWEQSLRDRARMWPTSHIPLLNDLLEPYRHHYSTYIPVSLPSKIISPGFPTWYKEARHPERVAGV